MVAKVRRLCFPPGRPLRWALPLLSLLLLFLLQWRVPDWSGRLEGWGVDLLFQLRGPETPSAPVVVVALDEASFQMLGDLAGENIRSWPRARWATLVDLLAASGARVIVLDVVFDTPGWDPAGDQALASALANAGNVVLAANLSQSAAENYNSATYSPPLAGLTGAAAGVGLANLPLDADGAIRRVSLLTPWGGRPQPALALVAALLFAGRPLDVPQGHLGADLSLPISFLGPEGTFPTVPLHRIWSGEAGGELLDGAIVLVGYTTLLEQDRHLAPFGGPAGLPGVEIHANAIETLLSGRWLQRSPGWLTPLLLGLAGLAALLLFNLHRPAQGMLALCALLALYEVTAGLLFARVGQLWPLMPPLASGLVVGSVALAERLIFGEREKRIMRRRFAGVMSPERVRAVMENWDELLNVADRIKDGSVLFADIRNFTSTTETLMCQGRGAEMAAFLSDYLDLMTEAVMAEGGVIYRMLGDGLLILFGLPEPLADHPLRAVRAALAMAAASERLQPHWPLPDEGPFAMGIGINCGLIADAIIGRGPRLDYAVFGDAVNTAARIEAHCKQAALLPRPAVNAVPATVEILVSAELYARVREQVLGDETIPPFEARGKGEPLQVVRILDLREHSPGHDSRDLEAKKR